MRGGRCGSISNNILTTRKTCLPRHYPPLRLSIESIGRAAHCNGAPVHPGALMREILEGHVKMTITEAARRMKISRPALYAVLNGTAAVTAEMALRFACLTGGAPEPFLTGGAPEPLSQHASGSRSRIGKPAPFKTNSPTSRQGGRNNLDFAAAANCTAPIRSSGSTMN